MTDNLQKVFSFTDLHLKKGRKAAKLALKGLSGIYAIIHIPSGRVYIRSSINLARRLAEHLGYVNTNGRLQNSLAKHGLKNFVFCVVELYSVDPEVSKETNQANLLALEQKHLVWLFSSLPDKFRFNFALIAGVPIAGRTHTVESKALTSAYMTGKSHSDETRVKISASMTGKSHSDETRAQMSKSQQLVDRSGENTPTHAFQSGSNNPMYGKLPANAMTIYIYSLDNVLVQTFSSMTAAAKFLNTSTVQVHRYVRSGKVWNDKYSFQKST